MNKYQFNIVVVENGYMHAGTKAVEDAKQTMLKKGYEEITFKFSRQKSFLQNGVTFLIKFIKLWFKLKPQSIIIFQYPLLGVNSYLRFLNFLLKKKGVRSVALIHDIDSLRYERNEHVQREIAILSSFALIISHNEKMSAWLKNKGLNKPLFDLQLFDYLCSNTKRDGESMEAYDADVMHVTYAGNLAKCNFIYDLDKNGLDKGHINFWLYGPGVKDKFLNGNSFLKYKGIFSPDEVVAEITRADFGLVWDGDKITKDSTPVARYMNYNNPHKFSLYIAAGLPVILPRNAALSDFVKHNNLGITIDNLSEILTVIPPRDSIEYRNMKLCVENLAKQVRNGSFLSTVLEQIEVFFDMNNR
jgi:hypothetical protein